MAKITQSPEIQEAFERFSNEIRNKTLVQAYVAVKDCVDQKEFCRRVGVNETRFSRVLTKYEDKLESTPATPS